MAQALGVAHFENMLHILPAHSTTLGGLRGVIYNALNRAIINPNTQLTRYTLCYVVGLVIATLYTLDGMQWNRHNNIYIIIETRLTQYSTIPATHIICKLPLPTILAAVYYLTPHWVNIIEIECRGTGNRGKGTEALLDRIILIEDIVRKWYRYSTFGTYTMLPILGIATAYHTAIT